MKVQIVAGVLGYHRDEAVIAAARPTDVPDMIVKPDDGYET
jgi:ABC-type protease/lipase transport system fused ATPase/permease subunit